MNLSAKKTEATFVYRSHNLFLFDLLKYLLLLGKTLRIQNSLGN